MYGACGRAVKALVPRSRGLGFDSYSAGHVCKALNPPSSDRYLVHDPRLDQQCWLRPCGYAVPGEGKCRLNMHAWISDYKPVPLPLPSHFIYEYFVQKFHIVHIFIKIAECT